MLCSCGRGLGLAWGFLCVSQVGAPGCSGSVGSPTMIRKVLKPWRGAVFRPQGRATLGWGHCSSVLTQVETGGPHRTRATGQLSPQGVHGKR